MFDEYNWVEKHFPVTARYESVIVENANVLTTESLNAVSFKFCSKTPEMLRCRTVYEII